MSQKHIPNNKAHASGIRAKRVAKRRLSLPASVSSDVWAGANGQAPQPDA